MKKEIKMMDLWSLYNDWQANKEIGEKDNMNEFFNSVSKDFIITKQVKTSFSIATCASINGEY